MPTSTQRKHYPLSLRLPEADLALIDRAAKKKKGRSRTDFMRDAAVKEAEEVIFSNSVIVMSEEGFEAFVKAIEAPAKPVDALLKVLQRKAPWEKG